MPKDFRPTPKRARKPKRVDPLTGLPYRPGYGTLAHMKHRGKPRRPQNPDHQPMALDESYDRSSSSGS